MHQQMSKLNSEINEKKIELFLGINKTERINFFYYV